LEYIADKHTDEARRKLEEVLEVGVLKYLKRAVIEETNPNEELPSDNIQKFRIATEKVKEKQKQEADSNKIADANVSYVCPHCKRPKAICKCGRSENERGHTNFPQPGRVNPNIVEKIISNYNQNSR
jgi:hypothetical protein